MNGPPARFQVRRPRRRRVVAGAILLAVVVLGALAIDAAIRVRDARRSLLAARSDLTSVQDTLRPLIHFDPQGWPDAEQFRTAQQRTQAATIELESAQRQLAPMLRLAPLFGWLPVFGPDIAHAPDVFRVGEAVASGTDAVLTATAPLFGGSGTLVDVARGVFVEHGTALHDALTQLDAARPGAQSLAALPWRGPLAPAGRMLAQLAGDLDRVPAALQLVDSLHGSFDTLLGFDHPMTYVVLGQNDAEIRPTGGFIGTMGVVTVQDGKVVKSLYKSSYDFDPKPLPHRPPPEPMQQFLGSSVWLLREANWWPNFPDTGKQVIQFMQADQHIRPDGVIAVDTEMLGLLLGVFGPISSPGFSQPLTAGNWLVQVENALFDAQVRHDVAKEEYLGPVFKELLSRAQGASRAQIPALLRALQAGVRERHLQVYVPDAKAEALVTQFGASGAMVPPKHGDFVAVVNANFSFDKIQPAIHQDITYLRQTNGVVDLLVTWKNEVSTYQGARYKRFGTTGAIYDWYQGKAHTDIGVFGDFVRIYLPLHSRLLGASGFGSPVRYGEENGFTVISGFLIVQDGQQHDLHITYQPPLKNPTSVTFWKQGGFTPGGIQVLANVESSANAGIRQENVYSGALNQDRRIALPH